MLDIKGCQKQIAETIVNKGADYLLSVKGNQKTLHNAIKEAFIGIKPAPLEMEKSHGRIEAREHYVLELPDLAKKIS